MVYEYWIILVDGSTQDIKNDDCQTLRSALFRATRNLPAYLAAPEKNISVLWGEPKDQGTNRLEHGARDVTSSQLLQPRYSISGDQQHAEVELPGYASKFWVYQRKLNSVGARQARHSHLCRPVQLLLRTILLPLSKAVPPKKSGVKCTIM